MTKERMLSILNELIMKKQDEIISLSSESIKIDYKFILEGLKQAKSALIHYYDNPAYDINEDQ